MKKIRTRLEALWRRDDEDSGEGGGGSDGQPPLPPLPLQKLLSPPIFSSPRSPPTLDDLFDEEGRYFGTSL